jgi:hypothetical protein
VHAKRWLHAGYRPLPISVKGERIMESTDVLNAIESWMTEEPGVTCERINQPGDNWRLLVKDQLLAVEVIQRSGRDSILFASGTTFPPQMVNQVNALSPERRVTLLWDLRLGLLQAGVEFTNLNVPPTGKIDILLTDYFDSAMKSVVMANWRKVRRAVLFLRWTVERALGLTNMPAEISSTGTGMVN